MKVWELIAELAELDGELEVTLRIEPREQAREMLGANAQVAPAERLRERPGLGSLSIEGNLR